MHVRESRPTGDGAHVKQTPTRLDLYGLVYNTYRGVESRSFTIGDMEGKESKACVIEVQNYRGNNNGYIVKELAILDLSTDVVNYFLFKPPFPIEWLDEKSLKTYKWLFNHFHHIPWHEGFTPYRELKNILKHYCSQYDIMYTTGLEKANWLKMHTTSTVIDYTLDKTMTTKASTTGICIGVKNCKHKYSNCALSKAYRVASQLKMKETPV